MAKAAVAAGADLVMMKVHPFPQQSRSDAYQTLSGEAFAALMRDLDKVAQSVGRTLCPAGQGACLSLTI
jgi:3-deoxy-7-phosphoheptulonate synthase